MLTEPRSIADTGLSMDFLSELMLKHIYFAGTLAGQQLADDLKLPFLNVVDQILEFLKEEEYVAITGANGSFFERSFQYVVTARGHNKVHEVRNVGSMPAPPP